MNERVAVLFYATVIFVLAVGFGIYHVHHVSTLFENDRHFSHLSNLEREMTFRTEMGFYYRYYKEIVNAPTFQVGGTYFMQDNHTEYPDVINALKKFNLYPEFMIGTLFRVFDSVTKYYGIRTKQCWEVSRGPSMSPVNSCEGLGDPMYFYLEFVWSAAGLASAMLFIYGVILSGSLMGGFVTILSFLFNHGHCTRVQWTPPLRESFAYPFLLMQMFSVSYCLRNEMYERRLSKLSVLFQGSLVSLTTALALTLWQFSQFVIATQTMSILLLYTMGIIHKKTLILIILSQLTGLLQASLLLFGNEFLFQSILFSLLLASFGVALGCEHRVQFPTFRGIFVLTAVFGVTFSLKSKISELFDEHDAHIIDLLRSKLTDFKNFHTMLYTCSPEFDFLPVSTLYDLSKTGLIPIVLVVICLLFLQWSKTFSVPREKLHDLPRPIDPDVAYNFLQLIAFTLMAGLVMRLKLFWTPHLCVMASLILSPRYMSAGTNLRFTLLVGLISIMSYEGINNITKQRNIMGEYVNIPFEEVLNWINSETLPTDVFAGPMSVMANVLLSTGRRIVNHPHYEYPSMRERTLKVYSIFSRRSPERVYGTLLSMGVDYVILEENWCYTSTRENCSMVELWDLIDSENKSKEPLCPKLFSGDPSPFIRAFANEVFVILSLKARQFVEIIPLQQLQI